MGDCCRGTGRHAVLEAVTSKDKALADRSQLRRRLRVEKNPDACPGGGFGHTARIEAPRYRGDTRLFAEDLREKGHAVAPLSIELPLWQM